MCVCVKWFVIVTEAMLLLCLWVISGLLPFHWLRVRQTLKKVNEWTKKINGEIRILVCSYFGFSFSAFGLCSFICAVHGISGQSLELIEWK